MRGAGTVLVAGFSARALARSAIAAGFGVSVVDGFGDRDLAEPAPRPSAIETIQPFDPDLAAVRAASLPGDAVAYTSNLENHPQAVATLAVGRALLGNGAAELAAARDAERVQHVLAAVALPVARVYADAAGALQARAEFLVKPRRSGGGFGIRRWRRGEPLRQGELLQERVEGVPASLVFAADGADVLPLGLTRQLIGDRVFGATGYHWCGNLIGGAAGDVLSGGDDAAASALVAARALTRAFGLRGINGIDVIVREGEAIVLEVNPRWTAAMELFERARARSLFPLHVAACGGRLEEPSRAPAGTVLGKAVVRTPVDCTVPDTDAWLADPDVRDVPASHVALPAGAPICTVLAEGATAAVCYDRLAQRAATIVAATTPRHRGEDAPRHGPN